MCKKLQTTKVLLLSVLLVCFSSLKNYAQILKNPSYLIETGAVISGGDHSPFWLTSNQYGLVTTNTTNEWIRAGIKSELSTSKEIDYDYGIFIADRYGKSNKLFLQQAYARMKLYFANFQVGIIEEKFGNQDSILSSGGLLWSGNARPFPKISINIPYYTPVPFTNGYLELKGGLSHGWFGDNQFINNTWLHHKYIQFRLGGKLPVHFNYAFHHFAQWGGESTDPETGKLPQSLKDYLKVFFAKLGDNNAPVSEQMNSLGDHLGSHNFGFDADLSKIKISVYWQTIFEDSSGIAFQNIRDGLWGVSVRTKSNDHIVNGVVYEFINTTDQSGKYAGYWLLNGKKYRDWVQGSTYYMASGNDNYFNHGYYKFGWTYDEMTIGTPLITSPAVLNGGSSKYDYLRNNKVVGHHIGIEGIFKNIKYEFFATYTLNYGTNLYAFSSAVKQYSFMLNTHYNNLLPWGMTASVAVGYDHGELYGNNFGLCLSLTKSDLLIKK